MILELTYYGNPILRKKAAKVASITPEIVQLVQDMTETMKAHDGIGLAAPQVNRSLALFITQVPIKLSSDPDDHDWEEGELKVFINPKIISHGQELWPRGEGCLSIPGVYGSVERPIEISVEAMDLEGKIFQADLTWLDARAFMHENDHINGVLFIDRMLKSERLKLEPELVAVKKKHTSKK